MSHNVVNKKLTAAVISSVLVFGASMSGCHHDQSTAALLAEASQYQKKGDMKAALIQLKNAVEKDPDNAQARLALGTFYLETGDVVSADKELRKAATLGIPAARTLPPLAAAMLAQGQFQKLLEEISPNKAQGSAPLLTRRGDALLALGKKDDAKQAYEQALAVNSSAAEPRIGLARMALQRKDIQAAHHFIDEATKAEPNNAEVASFKGSVLRFEGKPEEALVAYDRVIAIKPDHRLAHLDKAYIEIGLRKFDAAKADIDAASKITPGSPLVTYVQGLLDFSQGKFAAAQESLQKVLKSAPDHLPTILLSGAVELNLGAVQQSEQHLRKYLEAVPNDVYARKLLAQVLLKSSHPDDAIAELAPALKESSQDAQLLTLAGQSYMQVKDFRKASTYFEQASALAPQTPQLHTSLGLSKLAQGDYESGQRELELAASLDSTPVAGMALVSAQIHLKNYDKALAAAQALEKSGTKDPLLQNLKGSIYLAKNDPVNARASFENALAFKPGYFPAVANLAQLDLAQKQPDRARKRFLDLLVKDKNNLPAMAALAAIANAEGKPAEATSWLEKASAAQPDAVAPAIQLATQYLTSGEKQKALTLLRKYATTNNTPELLDMMARAQLANDDPSGALDSYSKLAQVLPKSAAVHMELAKVHVLLNNEAAAAGDLNKALALQPDFLPAQIAQVQLAERKGDVERAIATARQIQQQRPKEIYGFVLEGEVAARHQRDAAALAAYERAFSIDKSSAMMIKIHQQLKKMGKSAEAEQRLAFWQKSNPQNLQVAMYVAERQLADKNYKVAITQLEAILKQSPDNVIALNNLAWAYQQDKDTRAIPTAEKAYRIAADSPSVLDTLGWLLLEQGQTARALPLLQKAAVASAEPTIHYHLAIALQKSGDKARAKKTLTELLKRGTQFPEVESARTLLKQIG